MVLVPAPARIRKWEKTMTQLTAAWQSRKFPLLCLSAPFKPSTD